MADYHSAPYWNNWEFNSLGGKLLFHKLMQFWACSNSFDKHQVLIQEKCKREVGRYEDCFPFSDSQLIVLFLSIPTFATDCQNCFVELSLLQTFSRVNATSRKSRELTSSEENLLFALHCAMPQHLTCHGMFSPGNDQICDMTKLK